MALYHHPQSLWMPLSTAKERAMSQNAIHLTPDAAARLADALTRRRLELGMRSARQAGLQVGLDYRTITSLEGQRSESVTRNTLGILEMGLNWPPGYLNRLLSLSGEEHLSEVVLDVKAADLTPEQVEAAKAVAEAAFYAAAQQLRGNV